MTEKDKSPEPKWRRRADARPNEVMDAALELFMKKGFAATRVEEIAASAGLSKGAIYLYFNSKEDILKGLIQRSIIPIVENSERLAKTMTGDPQATISTFVRLITQHMSDPRLFAIPRLIISEAGNFPDLAQMYRDEVIVRGFSVLESMIEEGIEKGLFRPMNSRLAFRNIIGPVIANLLLLNIFQVEDDPSFTPEQFAESHLDILFNGLLAKPRDS